MSWHTLQKICQRHTTRILLAASMWLTMAGKPFLRPFAGPCQPLSFCREQPGMPLANCSQRIVPACEGAESGFSVKNIFSAFLWKKVKENRCEKYLYVHMCNIQIIFDNKILTIRLYKSSHSINLRMKIFPSTSRITV